MSGMIGRPGLTRRALLGSAFGAAVVPRLGRAAPTPEARIETRLAQLSLEEKVAQLFVLEAIGTTMAPDYAGFLTQLQPGGVILDGENFGDIANVAPFISAIAATNPHMPPLIAVDQEGGPVTRVPGDPSPDPITLGQEPDAAVRAAARARAAFLRGFGFTINLAPVADVAYTSDSIMFGRSFGSDPRIVAEKVGAFVSGARGTGVATTAKHFPGHGRTTQDSHETIPTIDLSLADWRQSDGLPFAAAVNAGVDLVMVGHLRYVQWDDAPATLSPVAIGVLRRDLGFGGPIITDDLGMGALSGYDPFDVLDRALAAGIDLFLYALFPVAPADLMAHLRQRVEQGQVPAARIDASVRRVLRLRDTLAMRFPGTDDGRG